MEGGLLPGVLLCEYLFACAVYCRTPEIQKQLTKAGGAFSHDFGRGQTDHY